MSLEQYCYEYEKDCDSFIPKIKTIYDRLVNLGYYHNDLRFKNILINPDTRKLYLLILNLQIKNMLIKMMNT